MQQHSQRHSDVKQCPSWRSQQPVTCWGVQQVHVCAQGEEENETVLVCVCVERRREYLLHSAMMWLLSSWTNFLVTASSIICFTCTQKQKKVKKKSQYLLLCQESQSSSDLKASRPLRSTGPGFLSVAGIKTKQGEAAFSLMSFRKTWSLLKLSAHLNQSLKYHGSSSHIVHASIPLHL